MLKAKEFPAQTENRRQWILDVVRENQKDINDVLTALVGDGIRDEVRIEVAQWILAGMEKLDRDAILQPGGILTESQIKALS